MPKVKKLPTDPAALEQHYLNLDIDAIAKSATSAEDLVRKFNQLIIDNGLSDKPISYTKQVPDCASWNIACGGRWVDPTFAVGTVNPAVINNPTFPLPNPAHDARMRCCGRIMWYLQNKEIKNIAVQEAPQNPNDAFYNYVRQFEPRTPIEQGSSKSTNIRVAMLGAKQLTRGAVLEDANLALIDIMKGLNPREYLITKTKDGKYVVNVHFDYAPPGGGKATEDIAAWQAKRVQCLEAIIKYNKDNPKPDIVVMGDLNIIDAHKKLKDHVVCFGCHGGDTEDGIISPTVRTPGYLASYEDTALQPIGSSPGIPPETMAAIAALGKKMGPEEVAGLWRGDAVLQTRAPAAAAAPPAPPPMPASPAAASPPTSPLPPKLDRDLAPRPTPLVKPKKIGDIGTVPVSRDEIKNAWGEFKAELAKQVEKGPPEHVKAIANMMRVNADKKDIRIIAAIHGDRNVDDLLKLRRQVLRVSEGLRKKENRQQIGSTKLADLQTVFDERKAMREVAHKAESLGMFQIGVRELAGKISPVEVAALRTKEELRLNEINRVIVNPIARAFAIDHYNLQYDPRKSPTILAKINALFDPDSPDKRFDRPKKQDRDALYNEFKELMKNNNPPIAVVKSDFKQMWESMQAFHIRDIKNQQKLLNAGKDSDDLYADMIKVLKDSKEMLQKPPTDQDPKQLFVLLQQLNNCGKMMGHLDKLDRPHLYNQIGLIGGDEKQKRAKLRERLAKRETLFEDLMKANATLAAALKNESVTVKVDASKAQAELSNALVGIEENRREFYKGMLGARRKNEPENEKTFQKALDQANEAQWRVWQAYNDLSKAIAELKTRPTVGVAAKLVAAVNVADQVRVDAVTKAEEALRSQMVVPPKPAAVAEPAPPPPLPLPPKAAVSPAVVAAASPAAAVAAEPVRLAGFAAPSRDEMDMRLKNFEQMVKINEALSSQPELLKNIFAARDKLRVLEARGDSDESIKLSDSYKRVMELNTKLDEFLGGKFPEAFADINAKRQEIARGGDPFSPSRLIEGFDGMEQLPKQIAALPASFFVNVQAVRRNLEDVNASPKKIEEAYARAEVLVQQFDSTDLE